jgi:hypothetical protein
LSRLSSALSQLTVCHVHAPLKKAGHMDGIARGIAGTDWTDAENDLLVADYFVMVGKEPAGEIMPEIVAKRLVEHLERASFVVYAEQSTDQPVKRQQQ